jgi:catechol 2,3-dioxygenase-like lactoylglutathione lyase family enzyme
MVDLHLTAKRVGRALAVACAVVAPAVNADPPAIKAIDHVGLSTADIARSIHFYHDLLGMEVTEQEEIENKPDYDHIFALKNVKAKSAMLRLGSMQIELFEFERPRGKAPDLNQPVNNPRIYHICFEVTDIQKEYERLKAAGVPFHYPPQDFGIAKAVYGRDPDGNIFELLQWVEKPHQ